MSQVADLRRGAFALETVVELAGEADPAAIGGAITVELCGHWEHEGACRWPHHTAVARLDGRVATIRTVATAAPDEGGALETRIRHAIATGSLQDRPQERWTVLGVRRVKLRDDEVELAARIARA